MTKSCVDQDLWALLFWDDGAELLGIGTEAQCRVAMGQRIRSRQHQRKAALNHYNYSECGFEIRKMSPGRFDVTWPLDIDASKSFTLYRNYSPSGKLRPG